MTTKFRTMGQVSPKVSCTRVSERISQTPLEQSVGISPYPSNNSSLNFPLIMGFS